MKTINNMQICNWPYDDNTKKLFSWSNDIVSTKGNGDPSSERIAHTPSNDEFYQVWRENILSNNVLLLEWIAWQLVDPYELLIALMSL